MLNTLVHKTVIEIVLKVYIKLNGNVARVFLKRTKSLQKALEMSHLQTHIVHSSVNA